MCALSRHSSFLEAAIDRSTYRLPKRINTFIMRMILASKPRNSAVAAVGFLRIDTVQLAHPGGEIGFWSFDDHVVVIAHPAPGMDRLVEPFAALGRVSSHARRSAAST